MPGTPMYVDAETVLAIFKAVWSLWSSEEDLLLVQAPFTLDIQATIALY